MDKISHFNKMAKNQKIPPGIDKHGDSWRVRIARGGFNINETFGDLQDAIEFRQKTVADIRGKAYVSRSVEEKTTLHHVLERYLSEVTPNKGGSRAEANRIKAWQREKWAMLPITSITSSHITAWRDAKVKAGKAPTTISNSMNILSAVFKLARAEWSIKVDNPITGIARPQKSKPRIAIPDDHLEKLMVKKIKDNGRSEAWLGIFIQVAAWTGIRQGELRALKWGDINFDEYLIYVKAELKGAQKNKLARYVTMLPIVENLLLAWRDAVWRDRKPDLKDWVFPSVRTKNQMMSEFTASSGFRRLMGTIIEDHPKIEAITFHDLRHWATTRLAPMHHDALDLAKTTGHKSLEILQRYYNPDPVTRAIRIRERAAELGRKK